MRLIHISDPHLTSLEGLPTKYFVGKRWLGHASWRWRRRHRHLRSILDDLCAALHSLHPDLIVVTGDLVHLGLPAEIEAAAEWLRSLGPPERVFLVPGNHDVYRGDSWAAVASCWGDYLRLAPPVSEEPGHWAGFPTRLNIDGIEVHGLNSGLPTPVFQAAGELGSGQCERLAARLAGAAPDAFRIVALHHPPTAEAVPVRKSLRDMDRLAPVLKRAHMALHGHGHFNRFYRAGALPVFATNSASKADASFRRFDIADDGDGWRVEMRLQSTRPAGLVTTETAFLRLTH